MPNIQCFYFFGCPPSGTVFLYSTIPHGLPRSFRLYRHFHTSIGRQAFWNIFCYIAALPRSRSTLLFFTVSENDKDKWFGSWYSNFFSQKSTCFNYFAHLDPHHKIKIKARLVFLENRKFDMISTISYSHKFFFVHSWLKCVIASPQAFLFVKKKSFLRHFRWRLIC